MKELLNKTILITIILNMATSIYSEDYYTASKKVLSLYQLMKDIHELFNQHEIVYWAAGGTLLGAVRHKGIIPLDVDLDIFIDNSHESLLLSIKYKINKFGYKLIKKRDFVYKIENHKLNIHCDIIFSHQEDDLIFYSCPILQKVYRRDNLPLFFRAEELFPLREYDFGLFKIIGPNNPHPYLESAYGKNYLKQAVTSISHQNNHPALPVGPLEDRIK